MLCENEKPLGFGGMANQVFRATRIPADHPALKGETLVPKSEDSQPLTQNDAL
jgi:hypothetical protein